MRLDNNQQAFFALVRAGLWEKDCRLSVYEPINFDVIYKLAEQQSLICLIAAGLDHVTDVELPKETVLKFVGYTMQLEQCNKAMNEFIEKLFRNMQEHNINACLVKGQGIAQCYERPLWRTCGDVDLFMDDKNYHKAKAFFSNFAEIKEENPKILHQEMKVGSWDVELHGTLRGGLLKKVDKIIDKIQKETFDNNEIRRWKNGSVVVPIPSFDNDILFVFTHILQHFFKGGIGLRQICDLSRLLCTCRHVLDRRLLLFRIKEMGMMSEWLVFASLAVNYIGIPEEAMPYYSAKWKWKYKSSLLLSIILETGNFGQNRDYTYFYKYPYFVRKFISFKRHSWDLARQLLIFPFDSFSLFRRMVLVGAKGLFAGE